VGERGKERRVENDYNKNNDRNTCVGPSLLGGRGPLRRGPLRRGPLRRGPLRKGGRARCWGVSVGLRVCVGPSLLRRSGCGRCCGSRLSGYRMEEEGGVRRI